MTRSAVSVLRADPDLGAGLGTAELARAQEILRAPCVSLHPGRWHHAADEAEGAGTLLVLDGLLVCDVVLAGSPSAELIGPRDVLPAPWRASHADTLLPVDVELTVLEPTRVALLDGRFQALCARWPAVAAALLERMEQRAWRLAKQAAISHLPAVHSRLFALFWHLADRWGRVTPTHVVLPLRILHRTLGKMVGAERSTVSLALKQLADAGLVTRRADGAWLLNGEPVKDLEALTDRCSRPPASFVPDRRAEPAVVRSDLA